MQTTLRRPSYPLVFLRVGTVLFVVLLGQWAWDAVFTATWPRLLATWSGAARAAADHPWLVLYGNHAWQLIIALGVIGLAGGAAWRRWSGLTLQNLGLSLRLVGKFTLVVGAGMLLLHGSMVLLGRPWPLPIVLTPADITGFLIFQLCISGLTEEIWFRGMIQGLLTPAWPGTWRIGPWPLPAAAVLAALFFGLAHVLWTVWPLHLYALNLDNALAQVGFGLWYGWARARTGSLVAPILAHGISNFISIGLMVGLALLTQAA